MTKLSPEAAAFLMLSAVEAKFVVRRGDGAPRFVLAMLAALARWEEQPVSIRSPRDVEEIRTAADWLRAHVSLLM